MGTISKIYIDHRHSVRRSSTQFNYSIYAGRALLRLFFLIYYYSTRSINDRRDKDIRPREHTHTKDQMTKRESCCAAEIGTGVIDGNANKHKRGKKKKRIRKENLCRSIPVTAVND